MWIQIILALPVTDSPTSWIIGSNSHDPDHYLHVTIWIRFKYETFIIYNAQVSSLYIFLQWHEPFICNIGNIICNKSTHVGYKRILKLVVMYELLAFTLIFKMLWRPDVHNIIIITANYHTIQLFHILFNAKSFFDFVICTLWWSTIAIFVSRP